MLREASGGNRPAGATEVLGLTVAPKHSQARKPAIGAWVSLNDAFLTLNLCRKSALTEAVHVGGRLSPNPRGYCTMNRMRS
jgi:hypothetical protein